MKWSSSTATEVVPNPVEIRQIFTQVTPRYDFLNGFLSFRLDRSWRRRAVEAVVDGHEESILDIGTGTGKLLDAFLSRHSFKRAGGIDLCESMLRKAGTGLKGQAGLLASDVSQCICFKGESFDIVSSSFTLRSLPNLKTFFQEVHRILKRNGRIVLLELTRPTNRLLRWMYLPYLKIYIPFVGAFFAHSRNAYEFLAHSILRFQNPDQIRELLVLCGFDSIRVVPYHGGIATLIVGVKF